MRERVLLGLRTLLLARCRREAGFEVGFQKFILDSLELF